MGWEWSVTCVWPRRRTSEISGIPRWTGQSSASAPGTVDLFLIPPFPLLPHPLHTQGGREGEASFAHTFPLIVSSGSAHTEEHVWRKGLDCPNTGQQQVGQRTRVSESSCWQLVAVAAAVQEYRPDRGLATSTQGSRQGK